MNEAAISTIAHLIVRRELLLNLEFYLVLLAMFAIGSAAVAYGSEYFRTRGKNYATKADFDELLGQLQKTTALTETIKLEVSHEDWRQREFKLIRRAKLEELLKAMHASSEWLHRHRSREFFGEALEIQAEPFNDVIVVATLYFPELEEISDFRTAYLNYRKWVLTHSTAIQTLKTKKKGQDEIAALQPNIDVSARLKEIESIQAQHLALLENVTESFPSVLEPLGVAIRAVDARASELMSETIRPAIKPASVSN